MPKWLHKPEASPYWHYDFYVDGRRFHGSTGSAKLPEAKRFVDRKRAAAIAGTIEKRRPEMTVNAAFGRWYQEHGQHLKEAENLMPRLNRLIGVLGKDRRLSEIDGDVLSAYVPSARAMVGPATVNHDLATLRRVLRKAKAWGVAVPGDLPFKELRLPEPAHRQRYLSQDEEVRLLAALPPDLGILVRFTLATGARLESATRLRWADIDDAAGALVLRDVKSIREGETHTLPITAEIRALLGSRRRQHPEYVFTYLCTRTTRDLKGGVREAGKRYPFSSTGWRKPWKRALAEAGIKDFRFHDTRHTAATKLLRKTGNLGLTQRMLGHADVKTTMRYAHVLMEDLAEGMSRMSRNFHEEAAGRGGSRTGQVFDTSQENGENPDERTQAPKAGALPG